LHVSLSTAQHDGALGDHAGDTFLGLLQHRQALFVVCSGVTNQPGMVMAKDRGEGEGREKV